MARTCWAISSAEVANLETPLGGDLLIAPAHPQRPPNSVGVTWPTFLSSGLKWDQSHKGPNARAESGFDRSLLRSFLSLGVGVAISRAPPTGVPAQTPNLS
jgi:hypothetical protein